MIRRAIAVSVAALMMIPLAGCASTRGTGRDEVTRITVASENCGSGWTNPHDGEQTFLLANTDIVSGDVFLVDAASGAVFAYVDGIAPAATANLRLDLGSGQYAFRCAMSDEDVAHGPQVVIAGSVRGTTQPVQAVTNNELIPVVKKYEAYVDGSLPTLTRLVVVLDTDIRTGRLVAARRDWLTAHLAYERLGAAYGAFGQADTDINGLPTGLPGGFTDAHFAGFHRIEYGLWHGAQSGELLPIADRLVAAVGSLDSVLADSPVATLDIAIRTHEIAENALQFDLTGQTDFGSGSTLASVCAELDATSELLTLMRPILEHRYPELQDATRSLAIAQKDIAADHQRGQWTALAALPRADRERLNADLSGLSSLLAPIASIAEPRTTS